VKKEDVKVLLDSIVEAKYEVGSFFRENPTRPKVGKPAGAPQLERLDKHLAKLGLHAPESYRVVLSIYNGIEDMLGQGYSLLSIDAVIDQDYELIPEMVKDFPSCSRFVICAGNTSDFVGFDTDTAAGDGDFEVVTVRGDGSTSRADNFESFLEKYLAALRKAIAAEKRDRDKLKDAPPRKRRLKT
jgi:hypothetical protein